MAERTICTCALCRQCEQQVAEDPELIAAGTDSLRGNAISGKTTGSDCLPAPACQHPGHWQRPGVKTIVSAVLNEPLEVLVAVRDKQPDMLQQVAALMVEIRKRQVARWRERSTTPGGETLARS